MITALAVVGALAILAVVAFACLYWWDGAAEHRGGVSHLSPKGYCWHPGRVRTPMTWWKLRRWLAWHTPHRFRPHPDPQVIRRVYSMTLSDILDYAIRDGSEYSMLQQVQAAEAATQPSQP